MNDKLLRLTVFFKLPQNIQLQFSFIFVLLFFSLYFIFIELLDLNLLISTQLKSLIIFVSSSKRAYNMSVWSLIESFIVGDWLKYNIILYLLT